MIDLATTPRRTLRVEEVMEIFDVSRRTVYYWISSRKVPSVIIEGKTRIEVDELRRRLHIVPTQVELLASSREHWRAAIVGCTKNTASV